MEADNNIQSGCSGQAGNGVRGYRKNSRDLSAGLSRDYSRDPFPRSRISMS